jgi:hypothetical protein
MPAVCRFTFPEKTEEGRLEKQLALAVISAECAYGLSRVRIAAEYWMSRAGEAGSSAGGPQIAVDVPTDVGQHIAQVLTGLVSRELGHDGFEVERIGSADE